MFQRFDGRVGNRTRQPWKAALWVAPILASLPGLFPDSQQAVMAAQKSQPRILDGRGARPQQPVSAAPERDLVNLTGGGRNTAGVDDICLCGLDAGGDDFCFVDQLCSQVSTCMSNADCPSGTRCLADNCCPPPLNFACLPECASGCNGGGVCRTYRECTDKCVPPGPDCWTTLCGATSYSFATTPVPPGFFYASPGPGSDPFTGTVTLMGATGGADTTVMRLAPMCFPDPLPATQTVPIEIVSLSLFSCSPITVTGSLGPQPWDVYISLMPGTQPAGFMDVTKTHSNGGVYTASLPVNARACFGPAGSGGCTTGFVPATPAMLNTICPAPWLQTGGFSVCGTQGFYPGWTQPPGTTEPCCEESCHQSGTPGHLHCTTPPDCTRCPTTGTQDCTSETDTDGDGFCGCADPDCATDPACQPESCCLPDGTCAELLLAQCRAARGKPLGGQGLCQGDNNNDDIDDACFAAPCEECGPGLHWIDETPCPPSDDGTSVGTCKLNGAACFNNDDCPGTCSDCTVLCDDDSDCAGGCGYCMLDVCNKPDNQDQDTVPTGAVGGIATSPSSCVADANFVAFGPATIHKRGPLDDSTRFPGLRAVNGHKDVIDTEIIAMSLTGGGITLTAGAGLGATPLAPTVGAVAEDPGDPSQAESFFDVFFEIDMGGGNFLYNHDPVRVAQIVDCLPPDRIYYHITGCLPLYTSPIGGTHVANLVSANHYTYPACCHSSLGALGCGNIPAAECQTLGGTVVPSCLGDNNGNMQDDACEQKCEVDSGSATGCTNFCPTAGDECLPSAYGCNPNNPGTCGVLDCSCDCQLFFDTMGVPFCQGNCPNGADICPSVPVGDGSIGNPLRCECAPPTELCPEPGIPWCTDRQASDCVVDSANDVECLVSRALVGSPTSDPVIEECACYDGVPACGPLDIQPNSMQGGFDYSCPGPCPDLDTENCRIHYDLNDGFGPRPQIFSTVHSSLIPAGAVVTCGCVSKECKPNSAGTACDPTICPDPNDVCRPVEIEVLPGTTLVRVVDCDCGDPNICHVEFDAALGPHCVNDCPDPTNEDCTLFASDSDGDGVIDRYRCDCVPPPPPDCELQPGATWCPPTVCPDPTEICRPKALQIDADGNIIAKDCDCTHDDDCHIEFDASMGPFCTGDCPGADVCTMFVSDSNGDGTIDLYECDCVPPPPPDCVVEPMTNFCPPTVCPNAGEICRPTEIRFGPGGIVQIVDCDCVRDDECHVEYDPTIVPPLPPTCVGDCPGADVCTPLLSDTDGDGAVDRFRCDCVPPPPPDCDVDPGTGWCIPTVCPDPNEICRPREIEFNPATGLIAVIECDCVRDDECHVELGPALPFCVGDCPNVDDVCEQFVSDSDGDGIIDRYRCECVPPPPPDCEVNPGSKKCPPTLCPDPTEKCRPKEIRIGPNGQLLEVIECDCVGDECHLEYTAATGPICVSDCPNTGETCELRKADTDADGIVDRLRCDCQPPPPPDCDVDQSTGWCIPTICPDPNEICRPREVEFDPISGTFIVIECDCVRDDECHVEVVAGADPVCVGDCPNMDDVCEQFVSDSNGDGIIDRFRCECVPPPPPDCEVNPGSKKCPPTLCPDPTDKCRPKEIRIGPNGQLLEVIECDCVGDECHLEYTASSGPVCVSDCPNTGETCELRKSDTDADGIVDRLRCDCQPPPPPDCDVDPATGWCVPTECPDPNDICRPVEIYIDPLTMQITVKKCDCVNESRCHVEQGAAGPFCVGDCPDTAADECEALLSDSDGDGVVDTFRCDCVPPPPPICEPNDTATGCKPTICEVAGEICRPTIVDIVPGSDLFSVVQCDCMPQDECHVARDPLTGGLTCFGACPDGQELCELLGIDTDGDGVRDRFSCECSADKCEAKSDGSGCKDFVCPPCEGECINGSYCDDPDCCLDPDNCLCYAKNSKESIKRCGTCFGECQNGSYCDNVNDPSCWIDPTQAQCYAPNTDISIQLCPGGCFGECINGAYCDNPDPNCCIAGPGNCACYLPSHPISQKLCPPPVTDDRCQPKCAIFDPETGVSLIETCECDEAGSCHIKQPVGIDAPGRGPGVPPCVQPDDSGTVSLPPVGCPYLSPEDVHVIINGLPADTTIELGPSHERFLNVDQNPGGTLAGEIETFDSDLRLTIQGTGDLAGFSRLITIPMACEVHTGPRTPGDAVQDFDTDMFRMQGQIFGDPDFDLLKITAGTDNGLPSPGHTTLTRLGSPGSDFVVDSFFDIDYRIEFQGAAGSVLQDMSGITAGTIRMRTTLGNEPDCTGVCPPNTVCRKVREPLNDGTPRVRVCCECLIACEDSSPVEPELIQDAGGAQVVSEKNRVISFRAGDPGRTQAIRVTYTSLPGPDFNAWNNSQLWLQAPRQFCEKGGVRDPGAACGTSPLFWASQLGCTEHCREWAGICDTGTCVGGLHAGQSCNVDEDCTPVIHVYHEGVVPDATYTVEVVDCECDLADAASYSPPVDIDTARHGDICGSYSAAKCLWTAPDTSVDIATDFLSVIDKFASKPCSPIKARADVEPNCLDWIINITDAIQVIDAFRGLPYPFRPKVNDPCDSPCSP